MQTSTNFVPAVQTVAATAPTNTSGLRLLSLSELMSVSGGLPKGTWATASSATPVTEEMCLPKGTW